MGWRFVFWFVFVLFVVEGLLSGGLVFRSVCAGYGLCWLTGFVLE